MPSVVRPLTRRLPLAALPAALVLACSMPTEPTAPAQFHAGPNAGRMSGAGGAQPVPLPVIRCTGDSVCWEPGQPTPDETAR